VSATSVELTWIAPEGAFIPRVNARVDDPANWFDLTDPPTYDHGRNALLLMIDPFADAQFFQLISQ